MKRKLRTKQNRAYAAGLVFLIVSSIFLGLVPLGAADGESWLSGYAYRKSHVIIQTANAGANYQVMITVANGSASDSGNTVYFDNKTQASFADVAFTDSGGTTPLDYWQDPSLIYSGANSTFYVEVAGNLSASNQTLYIYVGNATATSLSNGVNTFIFYEDFNGLSTADLNGQNSWTGSAYFDVGTTSPLEGAKSVSITGRSAVTIDRTFAGGSAMVFIQGGLRTNDVTKTGYSHEFYLMQGTTQIVAARIYGTGPKFQHLKPAAWEDVTPLTPADNTWYSAKIALLSNSTHAVWVNGANKTIASTLNSNNVTTAADRVRLEAYDTTAAINLFDTIVVGKYVSPEPVGGPWGALESEDADPRVTFGTITSNSTFAGCAVRISCAIGSNGTLSSYIASWNNSGSWVNQTAVAVAGNVTAILDGVFNSTVGTTVQAEFYANDSTGYWAASGKQSFDLTTDGVNPTVYFGTANTTQAGAACAFTATLSDDVGLAGYIFSTDNSGSWVNDSWTAIGGGPLTYNVTSIKTLNSTIGKLIHYKWFVQDLSGMWTLEENPSNYLSAWTTETSPVITRGGVGEWDHTWVVDPFIWQFGSEYRCYYTGADGSWTYQIGWANSTDMRTWTKQGVCLAPSWSGNESGGVSTANIIQLTNGTYYMYYHTVKSTSPYDQPALATSQDGITWTKYNGGACLFSTKAGTFYSSRLDPEAIFYEPTQTPAFTMIFIGYDLSTFRGGKATSNDGVSWSVYPYPVLNGSAGQWDATGVCPEGAVGTAAEDGLYYLFFAGYNSVSPHNWRIGIATSSDGTSWTKYAGNPIIEPSPFWGDDAVENPSNVVIYDGNYTLLMCATPDDGVTYDIGIAYLASPPAGDLNPLYNLTTTASGSPPTPTPAPTPTPTVPPIVTPPPEPDFGSTVYLDLYFYATTHTVNDVAGYEALVDAPDSATSVSISTAGSEQITWGFRVYLQTSSSATELTAGVPAATMWQVGNETALKSATYALPTVAFTFGETAMKFELYSQWGTGAWSLRAVYISELLFYASTVANTATFYLYLNRTEVANVSYATAYWGTPTYLSGVDDLAFRVGSAANWQSYYLRTGNFLGFLTAPYIAPIGNLFWALILFGICMSLYIRYRQLSIVVLLIVLLGGAGGVINLLIGDAFIGFVWLVAAFGLALIYWRVFR